MTGDVRLFQKPKRRSSVVRSLLKGEEIEIVGFKLCDSKHDGDECSTEPSEKSRWFKVKDKGAHIFWIWEQSPFETNLTCNERMDLDF